MPFEKVRDGKSFAGNLPTGGRLPTVLMALLIAAGAWGADGFHWCAVGNDASGHFCLSGQEFENTSRRVYTCHVGSYAPSKYDACIGGFAKKNNGWIADRDIVFTPNLTIPEKITYGHLWKGVSGPVTVLRPGAFKGYKELLSVSVPSTIQCYGAETFAGCTSLRSVNLQCKVVVPIHWDVWTNFQADCEEIKLLYDFKKDRNEYKFHPFFWQVGGKYVYPQDKDKIYYHHRRGFEDCFEHPQNIPFRSCL